MSHLIGKLAPFFKATAVVRQEFKDVSLDQGHFILLFFYPMDFTSVCASEIVAVSEHLEDFEKRDCKVFAVSCDSHFTHLAWTKKLVEENGLVDVNLPLLADKSGKIARDYGVYNDEQGVSSRAFFLIDKQQIVRDLSINDRPVGRSVEELLCLIDTLRSENRNGVDETESEKRGLKRPLVSEDKDSAPVKASKTSEAATIS
ncbi:Peroxiredoxin-2 [Frankliniella fusca]|uniref:thioredoxin-dependent peroxiredoxin n=1 Tax=Frankliniella fusca TaxID=407009 RepID=A0AAE1H336_9NEOP|nr:Peroxiredoxin-2 [Frankliniella fusca]